MGDVYAGQIVYAADVQDHETRLDSIDGTLVWSNATLVAGWVGTFKYRTIVAPANSLQLYISCTPGTKANGTTLTTLPVGYRPNSQFDIYVACDVTVAGGQSPHLNIATTGAVTCWGLSSATTCGFNGIVTLDN